MSLIDEALKRAQAAHQAEGRTEEGPRPETPAPLPDRRRITRARARSAVIVSLVAAALAVTGALLLRQARRNAPSERVVAKAPASVPGLPPVASEVTVAPPPRGLASGGPQLDGARLAVTAPPAVAERRISASPVLAPAVASSAPPVARRMPSPPGDVRPQARERQPRGPAEARTYIGEMPLPGGGKVTLDGIAYSEESPVAVLNGRVVVPGGYVEGFTVVRILPDRVELEAESTRVFLTLR